MPSKAHAIPTDENLVDCVGRQGGILAAALDAVGDIDIALLLPPAVRLTAPN